jgi:hypothetical protein
MQNAKVEINLWIVHNPPPSLIGFFPIFHWVIGFIFTKLIALMVYLGKWTFVALIINTKFLYQIVIHSYGR